MLEKETWGEGRKEIGEGEKEIQTYRCKISESRVWNVQCVDYRQELCIILHVASTPHILSVFTPVVLSSTFPPHSSQFQPWRLEGLTQGCSFPLREAAWTVWTHQHLQNQVIYFNQHLTCLTFSKFYKSVGSRRISQDTPTFKKHKQIWGLNWLQQQLKIKSLTPS